MSFANKVVIVTGASSGIGAATAILFAKNSASVVLVGRNKVNLHEVANKCKNNNIAKSHIIVADMSNDDDVKRIVQDSIKTFGKIDVLVNNAGFGGIGVIEDVSVYDRIMATNMRGVYLLTGLAVPHLQKTKGNIINISSVVAVRPYVSFAAYCISKAALDMYTKCAALELGPKGIRVNSVNPGMTRTNFMNVAGGLTKQQSDEFFDAGAKRTPLGRTAESEEVADQILHLASDKAKSITGINVFIDNGSLLQSPALPTAQ